MKEEKRRILDMLAEGTLTAEEAELLLDQLAGDGEEGERELPPDRPDGKRHLRVRVVVTEETGARPVNINLTLPLKLARFMSKFIHVIVPQEAKDALARDGLDLMEIDWRAALDSVAAAGGDIININESHEGTQVAARIYVE